MTLSAIFQKLRMLLIVPPIILLTGVGYVFALYEKLKIPPQHFLDHLMGSLSSGPFAVNAQIYSVMIIALSASAVLSLLLMIFVLHEWRTGGEIDKTQECIAIIALSFFIGFFFSIAGYQLEHRDWGEFYFHFIPGLLCAWIMVLALVTKCAQVPSDNSQSLWYD